MVVDAVMLIMIVHDSFLRCRTVTFLGCFIVASVVMVVFVVFVVAVV